MQSQPEFWSITTYLPLPLHVDTGLTAKIQYLSRMQISIRTFKHQSKTFSIVQYLPHAPGRKEVTGPPKDDTAYMFLDDRSSTDGTRKGKGKENQKESDGDDIQVIEPPSISDQKADGATKRKRRYHTLAVKPAASVIPMFQNLLNPLVMGVTKSARQVSLTSLSFPYCSFALRMLQ